MRIIKIIINWIALFTLVPIAIPFLCAYWALLARRNKHMTEGTECLFTGKLWFWQSLMGEMLDENF